MYLLITFDFFTFRLKKLFYNNYYCFTIIIIVSNLKIAAHFALNIEIQMN